MAKEQQRAHHRQRENTRRRGAAARQRHQDRHQQAYRQYLAQRIEEIKKSHSEAYQAFADETCSEREKTLSLLQEHPDGSLSELMVTGMICEYFRHHPVCPILEFWEWDTQVNLTPFSEMLEK